jgi:hypothetical protein
MSDEVIADFRQHGGSALALPLFSFRHMICSPMNFGPVASSFETHRFAMLLRMRS